MVVYPPMRRGHQTGEFMYYTYCLESLRHIKLYIGYTDDLSSRFNEHNTGRGGDYTSKNGPWKLIFYESHINKKDAQAMEKFYKTGYGREVLRGKLKNYLKDK